jgi:hypothetical protein
MGKLVGICVVLFMLAVGVLIVTGGPDLAALFAALRAQPLLDKVAWAVIVLVPLILLPSAVWLCDTLVRQRKAAQALELRLDGVRQGAKELAKSQIDAEAAVHHLARTDPEDAIGAVQQRLGEAERTALVQQQRNEVGDLASSRRSRIGLRRCWRTGARSSGCSLSSTPARTTSSGRWPKSPAATMRRRSTFA